MDSYYVSPSQKTIFTQNVIQLKDMTQAGQQELELYEPNGGELEGISEKKDYYSVLGSDRVQLLSIMLALISVFMVILFIISYTISKTDNGILDNFGQYSSILTILIMIGIITVFTSMTPLFASTIKRVIRELRLSNVKKTAKIIDDNKPPDAA